MDLITVGLVLTAAVFHTAWNAIAKGTGLSLATLWCALALSSLLGMPYFLATAEAVSTRGMVLLGVSACIHSAYFYTLARAFAAGPLSLVYPLARGGSIGIAALGAVIWLGELPSVLGSLGIAVVILGVLAVAQGNNGTVTASAGRSGPDDSDSGAASSRASLPFRKGPVLFWSLLSAVLIAGYSLVDKVALNHFSPLRFMIAMVGGTCLVMSPYMLARQRSAISAVVRRYAWRILAIAVAYYLAYGLVLVAFERALAGYVVASREVSVVLSLALGWFTLGERPGPLRWLGALLIVGGIALFSLSGR